MSLVELLPTTTFACVVGILVAEGARYVFQRLTGTRMSYSPHTHWSHFDEFVNTLLSGFILVICTFEKAILLWAGLAQTFFIATFLLFVVYCFVFSVYAPSPLSPLQNHWPKIKGGISGGNARRSDASGLRIPGWHQISSYFSHAAGALLGLAVGLQIGIRWLKFFWNGWLSRNHVTQLPVLDECIDCLNTGHVMGLLLEAGLTLSYAAYFTYVDKLMSPRDGSTAPLTTKFARNCLKAIPIVLFTYLFMDVTGAFSNPFLAYMMQRNCLTDLSKITSFLVVYTMGPLLGTVAFMLLREGEKEEKYSA